MSTKKGLIRGSKVTKSHTTVITSAESVLKSAKLMPSVKKISLGIIRVTKCSRGIKVVVESPTILKATVRGGNSIQTLYIYLHSQKDQELVIELLIKAF